MHAWKLCEIQGVLLFSQLLWSSMCLLCFTVPNENECYGLAAAGNKNATCPPSPRWGVEENGKKQAETGGSG